MSRRGFTGRRVAFLVSVAAALAFVLAIGGGSAKAVLPPPGGGCPSGSTALSGTKTLDGTTVHADWCQNAGQEITQLDWINTQENPWPQNGDCSDGLHGLSQSPYMWQFNANETFTVVFLDHGDAGCGGGVNGGGCWVSFDLKATVSTGPNGHLTLAETNSDTGCYGVG